MSTSIDSAAQDAPAAQENSEAQEASAAEAIRRTLETMSIDYPSPNEEVKEGPLSTQLQPTLSLIRAHIRVLHTIIRFSQSTVTELRSMFSHLGAQADNSIMSREKSPRGSPRKSLRKEEPVVGPRE